MSFEHMTEQLKAIPLNFWERLLNPCPTCQYSWQCYVDPVSPPQAFLGQDFVFDNEVAYHYSQRANCQISRAFSKPYRDVVIKALHLPDDVYQAREQVLLYPEYGPTWALKMSVVNVFVRVSWLQRDMGVTVPKFAQHATASIKNILNQKVLVCGHSSILKAGDYFMFKVHNVNDVHPVSENYSDADVWSVTFTTPTLVPVWQGPQEDK